MGFSHILLEVTFISKKVVVAVIPGEWKFKTILARNTIFEGN